MQRSLDRIITELIDTFALLYQQKSKPEVALPLFLGLAIRRIMNYYGSAQIFRGCIFVPNAANTHLIYYADFGLDDPSKQCMFYIGASPVPNPDDPHLAPGIAGTVYREGKSRVTHVREETKTDQQEDFKNFDKDDDGFPYASFVSVPLKVRGKTYGVLCLDSSFEDTFDEDPDCNVAAPLISVIAQILKWRADLMNVPV